VPCTNNLGTLVPHRTKVPRKIAGGFRTASRAARCARLRGVIETRQRQRAFLEEPTRVLVLSVPGTLGPARLDLQVGIPPISSVCHSISGENLNSYAGFSSKRK